MTERIVAVFATFRPDADVPAHVATALSQVDAVVVVDDGSGPGADAILSTLADAGAVVLRQPSNRGIAAALNRGIEHAGRELDADAVLTLDQDSALAPGYLDAQRATWQAARTEGIAVGLVTAASYGGHATPAWSTKDAFAHAFDPMQSGTLIPLTTWERVGRFDESLFIDGVDSDYTARVLDAGLVVLVGTDAHLEHGLGRRERSTVFGRPLTIAGREISYGYHSPARVYYIARNGMILTLRYGRRHPRWAARRLVEEAKAHGMRLVLGRERAKLVRAMAAGFADAARGRRGAIPARLSDRLR